MYTFHQVKSVLKNWYNVIEKPVIKSVLCSKPPISIDRLDILRGLDFLKDEYKQGKHYLSVTGKYIKRLPVKEIAFVLNIPPFMVYKLINDGIEIIKDFLNGEYRT